MNKVKWFAFYQWMSGLWEEGLGRIDRKGLLRNAFHPEVQLTAGHKIRVLLTHLGPGIHTALLRRTIKRLFGTAIEIVPAPEVLNWREQVSFDQFAGQYARAQRLLAENECDILVGRSAAKTSAPLLYIVGVEQKRQAPYLQIKRYELPVLFRLRSIDIFRARFLFTVASVAHVGEDWRALLRKLMLRLGSRSRRGRQLGIDLLNRAFLYQQLGEAGSTDDLKKAAEIYADAMRESSHERDPLAWAGIQDSLGRVLRLIGEREQEASVLQQAVAHLNEALTERTLERTPMLWVATQSGLAEALATLGGLKQPVRLEEAIAVLQAALAECPRDHAPLDWAKLQNDLGRVLLRLSNQSKDIACLEQAIVAFRAALEERRHDDVRTQWAMTQNNLANALLILGERSKGTAELHESVTAFRAALQERNRHVYPQQWAGIQHSLGTALTSIGVREADRAYLQQGVACFREALKVRTRKQMPTEWAATQHSLGTALLRLAELESDPSRLTEAIAAFENALLERTREAAPLQCAATQTNLGSAQARLAEFQSGTADLEKAVGAYRAAVEIYEDAGIQHAVKSVSAHLALAQRRLKGAAAN